jgi:hypothetical protein
MNDFFLKKEEIKTKKVFLKKEIEQNGLGFIKESLKNSNFKEINFFGK